MRFTFLLLDEPALALRFYKRHRDKTRFQRGDRAFVLLNEQQIVSALKLSAVTHAESPCFVMRSVLVDPAYRHQGLALSLIRQTMQAVREQQKGFRVICFAYRHLQALYESCGFALINEEDLPSALMKSWQRYDSAIKAGRMLPVCIMQAKFG